MKIILIALIAICQVFITIIPNKFKISDNRRKFPKDFTWTGWGLIILCSLTMISSVWLFLISDNEQNASQARLDTKLKTRDSLHEVSIKTLSKNYSIKVDSSYKKSEETFITVTAKFGLHYDSVNQRLEKKIDTSKVEIQPDLSLRSSDGMILDSIKRNTYFLTIYLQSKDAVSKNIDVKMYVIGEDRSSNLILPFSYVNKNKLISKGQWVGIPVHFEAHDLQIINLYVKGHYTNYNGNKIHQIDEFYSCTTEKKGSFGAPGNAYEAALRKFLKDNQVL